MDVFSWIVAGAALAATVLNVRKDWRCFLIWTATNSYWAVYDAMNGLYAQATLFVAYLLLSLAGLWKWRSERGA